MGFLLLPHVIKLVFRPVSLLPGGIGESSQASPLAAGCFDQMLYSSFTFGQRPEQGVRVHQALNCTSSFAPNGIRKPCCVL